MQINNKKNDILLDFMETVFFWYSSPDAVFEYVLRKKEENLNYCLVVSFIFYFVLFYVLFFSSETMLYSLRLLLYFVYLDLHVTFFVMFNHFSIKKKKKKKGQSVPIQSVPQIHVPQIFEPSGF